MGIFDKKNDGLQDIKGKIIKAGDVIETVCCPLRSGGNVKIYYVRYFNEAWWATSNAVCKNQDCVCGNWCLYECIKDSPVLIIGNINESQFWKKQFNLK